MSSSILNFFRKRSAGDEERDIQVTKRSRIEDSEDDYESETNISSVSGTTTEDTSTDTSTGSVSAKQALKFTNKWLKGREHWLEYIPSQGMFCKLCRKYDKHSYGHDIWNRTPCTRLRLQTIISHENSAAHRVSKTGVDRNTLQEHCEHYQSHCPKKRHGTSFFLSILSHKTKDPPHHEL